MWLWSHRAETVAWKIKDAQTMTRTKRLLRSLRRSRKKFKRKEIEYLKLKSDKKKKSSCNISCTKLSRSNFYVRKRVPPKKQKRQKDINKCSNWPVVILNFGINMINFNNYRNCWMASAKKCNWSVKQKDIGESYEKD